MRLFKNKAGFFAEAVIIETGRSIKSAAQNSKAKSEAKTFAKESAKAQSIR